MQAPDDYGPGNGLFPTNMKTPAISQSDVSSSEKSNPESNLPQQNSNIINGEDTKNPSAETIVSDNEMEKLQIFSFSYFGL